MRTEHLLYFLSLAETGSITQTSEELFTTHQNVSKMLRQLEQELDTELFTRTSKGLVLSPTGEMALPLIRRTIDDFGSLRARISALKHSDRLSGDLAILGSEISSATLLNNITHNFASLYPNVTIRFRNEAPLVVLQQVSLHANLIGVTVVLNNPDFADLYAPYLQQVKITPLLQDSYFAVVSDNAPLATRKILSLEEFAREPFAALTAVRDEDDVLIQLVKRFGGRAAFVTNSLQSHMQALLSGHYVSIATKRAYHKFLETTPTFSAQLIPFRENMQISIALVTNLRPELSEISQAFVDFLLSQQIYL